MPSRYQNIPTTQVSTTGSLIYQTNIYPEIPATNQDYYVITTTGDRLDLMAYDFYQDTSYWWVIATANALSGDSLYPPVGVQLRIPYDLKSVITSYNIQNNE
jgi:hypothetical protein